MAAYGFNLFGGDCRAPAVTQTAGTLINALVPPSGNPGWYTRLLWVNYIVGTTTHNITILREKGRATVNGVAASGQAVFNISADPGGTAANLGPNGTISQLATDALGGSDWLVFQLPDGTYYFDKVSSIATLAVTMTNNLPTNGLASGATVWFMGQAADTNPLDILAAAHPKFNIAAAGSATVATPLPGGTVGTQPVVPSDIMGLCVSTRTNSPLLIQSSNGTTAGTIDSFGYAFSDR